MENPTGNLHAESEIAKCRPVLSSHCPQGCACCTLVGLTDSADKTNSCPAAISDSKLYDTVRTVDSWGQEAATCQCEPAEGGLEAWGPGVLWALELLPSPSPLQ